MTGADLARLLVLAALWGGSFLFMRVVAPVLGAVPTAFSRVVLGALGLWVIVRLARRPLHFKGLLPAALMLGVVNSGLPFLLFSHAARALPAGYSAILNATTPLMGVLLGAAFFKERITAARLGGVVLGLTGVAVLTRAGPLALDAVALQAVGACLLATVCYGLAGFLTRRWITERGGLDSRLVALGSQIGAIGVISPFLAWQAVQAPLPLAGAGPAVWAALLALGLLCTAWAYVLYFRLVADVGPVRASTVTLLIPVFGVVWGAWFLGETLTLAHAGGGGLIALALWLVLRQPAVATVPAAR
jgi:drug/metabolite transporter (DMT)-like permease